MIAFPDLLVAMWWSLGTCAVALLGTSGAGCLLHCNMRMIASGFK
ncbi:hypothetical protein N825_34710 [Skermanella stibiiresistens SB22]|uniref:Uncharacterized protein n=1 Tax=Skermanella stibiiresistens SB22 TaxID=1385369 RepID=W9H3N9_9PROT|nr:hypothetical protein N825_34710 [Skermanella stibiiresistens SB22]